jgi:hypothetical protein
MCFWFGLEILRLIYKKVFFEILNGFYPSKKEYKSWKKISSKLGVQGIKRSGILHWFQKCAEVSSLAKWKKKFYRKTQFLGTWKILQKIVFLRKIFGNFLTQEFYTFLKLAQNSASFDTLHAQFQRNFFSTLIRDGAVFL